MINNPCLVTIHHVSARQEEETVMKSPITTCLQPGAATASRVKPPFSHQLGSRCSRADLGTLCSPVATETTMQQALSSSCLEQTRVDAYARLREESKWKENKSAGLFLAVCSGFQDAFTQERMNISTFWSYFSVRKLSIIANEPVVIPTAVMLWTYTLQPCCSCSLS